MKANELMIGDFVTRQNYENKSVICKIIGLSKNSISVEFDNGSRSMGASEDSINPIPLTSEILEKNGFEQNGISNEDMEFENEDYSDETYVWSQRIDGYGEVIVSVYIEYGNECVEIHCPNGAVDNNCRYVHQLQHALRLCGIEKNIEL